MLRIFYIILAFYVLFMWSMSIELGQGKATLLMTVANHGIFGSMMVMCVWGIIKNGDFY